SAPHAKRAERQLSFGDSHVRTLRVASVVEGRPEDAEDYSLRAYWADKEVRTVNQAMDALGKAAVMLNVPPELLWDRIPGVDFTTAQSWKRYADDNPKGTLDDLNDASNVEE